MNLTSTDGLYDSGGKKTPKITITQHVTSDLCSDLLPGQRAIAMISEMIHTASLVHDDVIDGSDRRRGKTTINEIWGEKKVGELGPAAGKAGELGGDGG